eukprot:415414-Prorocentrum_minimum.AAC.3
MKIGPRRSIEGMIGGLTPCRAAASKRSNSRRCIHRWRMGARGARSSPVARGPRLRITIGCTFDRRSVLGCARSVYSPG